MEQLIPQRQQYARILHNVTLAYPPELRANALAPIQKALDEINVVIAFGNEIMPTGLKGELSLSGRKVMKCRMSENSVGRCRS